MEFQASEIAELTRLLSPERLKTLTKLTGSAEAAIKLHQETLRLGASLMYITATVEIALRNAASENLGHFFAVPNWLSQPPITFGWRQLEKNKIKAAIESARRAEYAKLSQAEKGILDQLAYPNGRPPSLSHARRAKDRQARITVSEGKVIAELTLFFWKRLFSQDYEQSLWKTTLKRMFPNKSLTRSEVAKHLERIYQSRNRLAHHETVIHDRFRDTLTSINFVVTNLEAPRPSNDRPLMKLLENDLAATLRMGAELHAKMDSYHMPAEP